MQFQSEIIFKLPDDRKELKWLLGIYYVVIGCTAWSVFMLWGLLFKNPILAAIILLPYGVILYVHFKLSPMLREAWRRIKEEVNR